MFGLGWIRSDYGNMGRFLGLCDIRRILGFGGLSKWYSFCGDLGFWGLRVLVSCVCRFCTDFFLRIRVF